MDWYVYMLRCEDGSLYTGIASDVEKRFAMHKSGHGAKYTRSHPPVAVVYREQCSDKAAALGVWLHGRAGELLAQEMTAYCASPRELVTRGLGLAFRELLEA